MSHKKVAISTLGCKVNQYETQAMLEMFEKEGYRAVDETDETDVFVINTCTVTHTGDKKSRQLIRRALKKNPNAIIAVVGCYSQLEPEEVESIDGVDVILGTRNRHRIVDAVESAMKSAEKTVDVNCYDKEHFYEPISIEKQSDMTRAYVKIQDGCNQYCSYCIIPYARGPVRSRRTDEIIDEVKNLVNKGYQEVVLTGIHLTSFGKDKMEPEALLGLLKKIDGINSLKRIRLGSLDPAWFNSETVAKLMSCNKLCHHFHLSLQSGSDRILKKMNRQYDTNKYKDILKEIRKHDPDSAITTDIITGFPGETEKEFKETCRFLDENGFSEVHIFKYSPRKGTKAAEDPNQISENIKRERSEILHEIVEKNKSEYMKRFVGKTVKVIFEQTSSEDPSLMIGHTAEYLKVKVVSDKDCLKKMRLVYISHQQDDYLFGNIIYDKEKQEICD
ncbi:MAG: tRNA (N(6)-L-threonylcarbamoyladenosine(37)-C(2))-methylthiotransferase MtaB [Tindallia sp. MSAO_Bac2]|nr:MAG: tRNA (N(6)-L-threonylcarbamoyladenosine(37)-C(2))-methylthiotransferase MtaB [Tindallia sp. MSAO_Bac2]